MKEVIVLSLPGSGTHYNGAGMAVYNLIKEIKLQHPDHFFHLVHAHNDQIDSIVYNDHIKLSKLYPFDRSLDKIQYIKAIITFLLKVDLRNKTLLIVGDSFELIPFMVLSRLKGVKRVVIRTTIDRKYSVREISIRRIVYRAISKVICLSPSILRTQLEFVPSSKLIQIPNGIHANSDLNPSSRASFSKIVFVGALNSRKNLHVVVRAFIELIESKLLPPCFCFEIYGEIEDNSYVNSHVKLTEKYSQIKWKGFSIDKDEVFDNAKYLILPSTKEGMPNSVLEAMTRNIIPIIANFPGFEAVLPEETGLVVDLNVDEQNLVASIVAIIVRLENNETFYSESLNFLKEWVLQFDYTIVGNKYIEVLTDVD